MKIRGNAAHVAEKYQVLSRDASASGDRVAAEGYLQHAEHYIRIVEAANAQAAERQQATERQRSERQTEAQSNQLGDGGGGGNGEDRAAPLVDNRAVEKAVDTPQPVVPDSAYDYLIKDQTAQAADAAAKAASPSASTSSPTSAPTAASADNGDGDGDGEAAAQSERKPRTRRAPRRKPVAADTAEAEPSPADKGKAA